MGQEIHAPSITEDDSTLGGFALIDLRRKTSRNPIMLSFRRVDHKPRFLGPKGWHREVCWWETERIGASDLSTIVRVGPAVVDRISELDPIQIAVRGEPYSFSIVYWPALTPSPAGLGQAILLLPRSVPAIEHILPEFETQILEPLSRELGLSSKPDERRLLASLSRELGLSAKSDTPSSPIGETNSKAQSSGPAPASARKHQRLASNGSLVSLSPTNAAALLTVLGSLSAILSAYASPNIISAPYFNVPVLPAVYFAFVLCAGIYLWKSKSKLHFLTVFVATIIAWICAVESAASFGIWSTRFFCPTLFCPLGIKAASGFVGGFIGSLIIFLAMIFICREFRNWTILARILAVGASAGLLLAVPKLNDFPELLPLFLVWQPAIAACIAHTLACPQFHPSISESRRTAGVARLQ